MNPKQHFRYGVFGGICILLAVVFANSYVSSLNTGAPPYDPDGGDKEEVPDISWFKRWKRPDGPASVALQVGHWKSSEVPDELKRLRTNTGATGGGKTEWEVNYEIANLVRAMLEKHDITVELLPATIPPEYWADVFVSIHADGNVNPSVSGYKVASPRRDQTGKAKDLAAMIHHQYGKATGLAADPSISRNMTGYYAFSWRRYTHAVHPMTVSSIVETGFLTNASDRETIVDAPDKAAEGIANGIIEYLKSEGLLPNGQS